MNNLYLDKHDGILYLGDWFFLDIQTIRKNTPLAKEILVDLYRPISVN